jgi:lipoprotein-releasing system permease protein
MYQLLLCQRYLRTRYIALASIISVTLGVATMIVVNSVMAGFGNEMRDRLKGVLSDLVVETHSLDGVENYQAHAALIQEVAGEYIVATSGSIEIFGILSFPYAGQWISRTVTLIGIDPPSKAQVGPLRDYLLSYQPQRDGVKVVGPPERDPASAPDWELTASARQYRKEISERRRLFHEAFERERALDHDPFASPPAASHSGETEPMDAEVVPVGNVETESTTATASDNDTVTDRVTATSTANPEAADVKAGDEMAAGEEVTGQPVAEDAGAAVRDAEVAPTDTESASRGITVDPLADVAFPGADQPAPEPGALLPGRLYVGQGLISFPTQDSPPETVMMAQPGDDVKISTITAGRPPEGAHFNATIVDVFKSGMSEYDSSLVFCNLEYLQQVRGMVDPSSQERAITSIQIKLRDYRDAEKVKQRLQAVFPSNQFSVRTWEEKQGPLLAAVDIEAAILNVLLFLIIAVAGFGILAIFFMIVVEKTRDIGILKALGASSRGVMTIFLSYGLSLGMVGAGAGVIAGLLFVHYINEIEKLITWLTGKKVFDDRIYYFPEIPTQVNPGMVLWVAAGAILIAVLASILPARRAAALQPVKALRYE